MARFEGGPGQGPSAEMLASMNTAFACVMEKQLTTARALYSTLRRTRTSSSALVPDAEAGSVDWAPTPRPRSAGRTGSVHETSASACHVYARSALSEKGKKLNIMGLPPRRRGVKDRESGGRDAGDPSRRSTTARARDRARAMQAEGVAVGQGVAVKPANLVIPAPLPSTPPPPGRSYTVAGDTPRPRPVADDEAAGFYVLPGPAALPAACSSTSGAAPRGLVSGTGARRPATPS